MPEPFERARLGRTSLEVTKLGFGTAALGMLYAPVEEAAALAVVRRAYALGCRFFDSAPMYGAGLAEHRLGEALAGLPRADLVLSTKAGYAVEPKGASADVAGVLRGQDFSYDGVMRSVEGSLRRLGRDQLEIVLLHDPDQQLDAAAGTAFPALRQLRDEGVIRAIGAGMNNGTALARLARMVELDCAQIAGRYTLLDQSALAALLPLAEEQGLALYVGGPLNSGILADPYAETVRFNYQPADAQWIAKARRLDALCREFGVPLKAAALQFPLGHPAVVAVLTGARSVAELEENVAAFRAPIPAELWAELRRSGLLDEAVPTPS